MDLLSKQFTSLVSREVEAAVERAVSRLAPRFRLDERDRPGAGTADAKAYLTNAEAQKYLGLSKATLARYRADGTLPHSKIKSSVFYRVADVEALLERCAVRAGYGDSSGHSDVPVLASPPLERVA